MSDDKKQTPREDEIKAQAAEPDVSGYDITPASEKDEPEEKPKQEAMTAFLVYVTADGQAIGTSDIQETLDKITIKRPPTLNDIRRACLEVTEDVRVTMTAQASAQHTIQTQMQMAMQAQEAQRNQQVLQDLDLSQVRGKG